MNESVPRHNFLLTVVDTDSIAFVKPDMSPFSEEEQQKLIDEINSFFPEHIKYSHDGYFEKCVVLKAKNYITYDGKKMNLKGSALKAAQKETILRKMLKEMIDVLIYG